MVAPAYQGRGSARRSDATRWVEARRAGYLAMQFDFVVSTNPAAVALWRKLGFQIVGTLPKVYRHRDLGLVDAYA